MASALKKKSIKSRINASIVLVFQFLNNGLRHEPFISCMNQQESSIIIYTCSGGGTSLLAIPQHCWGFGSSNNLWTHCKMKIQGL